MKHQNYKSESVQFHGKPQNEDFHFEWATSKGHVFLVIDFANFSYPNLNLTLQRTLEDIIDSLDKLAGLSIEAFLGHLAKELNNFVFTVGRDNCDGKLFCVTAIAVLYGSELFYLTYGDSRINVFTDNKLLLLNGAKYQTLSLISDTRESPLAIRENPEQMGRNLMELPLNHRVRSHALGDKDVVLLFTDGLEESVTPQQRLAELQRLGSSEPKAICDALIKIADGSDDRTITVIAGPYTQLNTSVDEQINRAMTKIYERIGFLEKHDEDHIKFGSAINRVVTGVQENQANYAAKSELADLREQLSSKVDKSDIDSLKLKLDKIETASGKKRNPNKEGPQFFVIEPEALASLLQKAANEKAETNSRRAEFEVASSAPSVHDFNPTAITPGQEREPLRMLRNQKVVALSIFIFGVLFLWLSQAVYNWFVPERWTAQTQGESLIVRRGAGPTLRLKLAPPIPTVNREVGSFEELVPLLEQSERSRNAEPLAPSTAANEGSVPPSDTVEVVEARKGDNLAVLAQRHKTTAAKLRQLNPNINWNNLKQSQTIQVPANVDTGNPQK